MELPVFNRGNTNGTVTAAAASNRTAAQSEILALNGTQFLVLSRDGNGLGNDPTVAVGNDGRPPVFKSVLLIDTAGATNINGTGNASAASVAVIPATTPAAVVATVPSMLEPQGVVAAAGAAAGAGAAPATGAPATAGLAIAGAPLGPEAAAETGLRPAEGAEGPRPQACTSFKKLACATGF
jgi:hypothetical protein